MRRPSDTHTTAEIICFLFDQLRAELDKCMQKQVDELLEINAAVQEELPFDTDRQLWQGLIKAAKAAAKENQAQ